MTQVKICSECGVEYYPHITTCADCGVALLSPGEHEAVRKEKKATREKALEKAIPIDEGELNRIKELSEVLLDSSIPCAVASNTGCCKGGCEPTFLLTVSEDDAQNARKRIEEYYKEVHPEIHLSNELISQGKCPACGSVTAPDAQECPDCGLILLVVKE